MDGIDRDVLALLQVDARLSWRELGDRVNPSPNARAAGRGRRAANRGRAAR